MPKRIPKHINTYCTYCKAEGKPMVKAVWRISYDTTHRACEEHKAQLALYESKLNSNDKHLSEADYQTWMRL